MDSRSIWPGVACFAPCAITAVEAVQALQKHDTDAEAHAKLEAEVSKLTAAAQAELEHTAAAAQQAQCALEEATLANKHLQGAAAGV